MKKLKVNQAGFASLNVAERPGGALRKTMHVEAAGKMFVICLLPRWLVWAGLNAHVLEDTLDSSEAMSPRSVTVAKKRIRHPS